MSRYTLTGTAESLFPKRYDHFSNHLVDAIVEEFGEEGLIRIFERWEADLHGRLDAVLPPNPAERLQALARHQTENGFMASVRSDGHGIELVERNCPILAIATRYPQICRHEAALFGRTLKWRTSLQACQASGDAVCVFRIGRAPRQPAGNAGITEDRGLAENAGPEVKGSADPSEIREL